ncbi:MAG: PAS domain-containing protein [Hydrogenophaga sp.]|jgi:PAS domain S-box-containing protein|uniref:PAS domain-containing protein n=1 Tax=Hydrogenophaga sp. TaxID=1904254 RepID=UPI0025C445A9|nr:PAS domain-containing protein [Hydrogenophaga sp.]MDO9133109.1 PAS domain-containing protein [Hydrogenophaga sp.]MDP3108558.1 PAS domain-containing protein [Hydrogenophaga sp.]MDP3204263.1 PAS domain-containing protein [Hydrogenophaga sp.]MDP3627965.1 PAS domain-containing protein [Hydrogenophaga sp.]
MSYLTETSSYLSSLRERATTQLTGGIQVDLARASTSDAMAVLYKLASSPDTAVDAMALLHELQVHQVEVDMQHEELRQSRVELENDLIRQTDRFERAPAAYLVVDEASVLCEINAAGLRLLRASGDDVLGRPLTSFLSAPSRERLRWMLGQAKTQGSTETVELELQHMDGLSRMIYASADKEASSDRFLVVLMASPSQS